MNFIFVRDALFTFHYTLIDWAGCKPPYSVKVAGRIELAPALAHLRQWPSEVLTVEKVGSKQRFEPSQVYSQLISVIATSFSAPPSPTPPHCDAHGAGLLANAGLADHCPTNVGRCSPMASQCGGRRPTPTKVICWAQTAAPAR